MEFDIHSLMSDVSAAFAPPSSHWADSDVAYHTYEDGFPDAGDRASSTMFDDFIDYSPERRGNTPLMAQRLSPCSQKSVECLGPDDDGYAYGYSAAVHSRLESPPKFLNLGMYFILPHNIMAEYCYKSYSFSIYTQFNRK